MKKLFAYALLSLFFVSQNIAAEPANWDVKFKNFGVKYDNIRWKKIFERNASDMSMSVIQDMKMKGAFITMLRQTGDAVKKLVPADYESYLFSTLQRKSPKAKILGKTWKTLSGTRFRVISYSYNNPKFGPQFVKHLYFRKSNSLVLLIVSWPRQMSTKGQLLPRKTAQLLNNIRLVN